MTKARISNHFRHVAKLFCIAFILVLMVISEVRADEGAIERLQSFLERLQSIEADFTQHVDEADGHMPQASKGRFSAKRPGLFRWDYHEPFEQMILSDGSHVYYYEMDLAQVTKTNAALLEETPAAFFVSGRPLTETFSLNVIKDPMWSLPGLRLTPLQEGAIQQLVLTLHPQKDEILNLEVLDSLGNHSRFTFQKIRFNQTMEGDRFQFIIPDGVDVIDETGKKPGQNNP